MAIATEEVTDLQALIDNLAGEKFTFNLEEIPDPPTRESFDWLACPGAPDSAQKAVKAIYSFLFWEEYDGPNKSKIDAAMTSPELLTRWIKDRAGKGITVFDELSGMAERANLMFQVSYEESGLLGVPDDDEMVYERFSDFVKNKLDTSMSTGEKSEIAWAIDSLIPDMRERGLDIRPLIGSKNFYSKFRHYIQAARQRDRMLTLVDKKFEEVKRRTVNRLKKTTDELEINDLQANLVKVLDEEGKQKKALLEDYAATVVSGLASVIDPSISVRDFDDKWRMTAQASDLLGSSGYTAMITERQVIAFIEFDYSQLFAVESALKGIVDIKGMTDPLLIIQQLEQTAQKMRTTLGGG